MEITAVKLRNSYQIYYVETNNIFIKPKSKCIVEIDHGIDMGSVVQVLKHKPGSDFVVSGKVLRKADDKDNEKVAELEGTENKAFAICREKAKAKNLDMKLVAVKCLFDKTKIIFYFVAENRIDFRELVRELAAVFRTRIEMRQIGVRDEARLVGGYGPCGKAMCCLYQNDDFEPVSIKMAKEQNLNLNSMKISGMCGRLLCCLGFEYGIYRELNSRMPAVDTDILAGDKKFTVVSVNTIKESITIKDGDRYIQIKSNDLKQVGDRYVLEDHLIAEVFRADE